MCLRRSLLREEGWRSVSFAFGRIFPSLAVSAPRLASVREPASLCQDTLTRDQRHRFGHSPHRIGCKSWYSTRSNDGEEATRGKELHRLYEEQLLEMKEERELLFGFTESDHSAWTSAGSNHRHDASFLDEIDAARFHRERDSGNNDEDTGSRSASHAHPGVSNHGSSTRQPSTATLHAMRTDSHAAAAEEGVPGASTSDAFFSHVSADGSSVRMVDVGGKATTQRVAVAQTRVVFPPEVVQAFEGMDWVGPKGPIFATAKLAGIMAAKRTSELIPLCHPLPLDSVNIDITMAGSSVAVIQCECRVTHKTGVEMEALTGASIAALTVYDMVKAVSHRVRIEDTVLISKSGGKRAV